MDGAQVDAQGISRMKPAQAHLVVCIGALALLGLTVRADGQFRGGSVAPRSHSTGTPNVYIQRLPPVERVARSSEVRRIDVEGPSLGPNSLELPSPSQAPAPLPTNPSVRPELVRPGPAMQIPRGAAPWWQAQALRPLGPTTSTMPVDVGSLIVEALRHSARVRAISDNAIIAETSIIRADAEFDTRAFMESKFVRTSIPTGSTLEAGFNVPRLREEDWFYSAGLRRKNQYGGKVEIAQRVGLRDSNSNFFFPYNQGNSRLTMSYNQPLLNGAGVAYNTSLIVLANLDTRIAVNRSTAELQEYLLEVTETHWQLYLQRSVLLQQQRHLERAQGILARLEHRRDLDSLNSQIARARAAVALRVTALIRANTAIRNAESRLRALVNSPEMLANRTLEMVPIQAPSGDLVAVDLQRALVTALENRPEIDAATQEIEAARVRLNVARNELLPVLDGVLETYVSGLQGDYNISQSVGDQFVTGEPSYTAGLVFDVPLGRRAAKANETRRLAELRQLSSRFQATVETVHSEVEVAVREVETTHRELQSKFEAMQASAADMDYLQRRWEMVPGEDRAASFMLEDLLDSQDRLALAEFNFAQGQIEYALSLTRLNRALGTLLKHEQVAVVRGCEQQVPTIRFEKQAVPTERMPPPSHD